MYIPMITELIKSFFTESEYWEFIQENKLNDEVDNLTKNDD
jgi:hypothetical protein